MLYESKLHWLYNIFKMLCFVRFYSVIFYTLFVTFVASCYVS